MALEWATKIIPGNTQMVMITDSTATIGAFTKGKSSKHPMMSRCRRQATLKIVSVLTVLRLYAHSAYKPADDGTRE